MRVLFWSWCVALLVSTADADRPTRPNILWLTSEDNGPHLGCYGDTYADTPNLDALARRGLIFDTCWSSAPVCAPARTTILTGIDAPTLGAQHMRSAVPPSRDTPFYPTLLRDAGYCVTNNSKTDYNFRVDGFEDFDGGYAGWHDTTRNAHWRNRPDPETPFMAVFNSTVSHESKIRRRPHTLTHDPAEAPLPVYHPDTPEVRHDWAQYYDNLTAMDAELGKRLDELEADGLAGDTIVFYYGDHGSGMPRSKRQVYDSGLRVPLIVHFPERWRHLAPPGYRPGGRIDRPVAFVDFAPTLLAVAGIDVPDAMRGRPFAGPEPAEAPEFVFGWRGRMDGRVDCVRGCTDGRYVYVRHFYPDRPALKHVAYMFETPTTSVWKRMYNDGELTAVQRTAWESRPVEWLFDRRTDPDEVTNLAAEPSQAGRIARMRGAVREWMIESEDLGVMPESQMHAMADGRSPRDVAEERALPFDRLVDVMWRCTSEDRSRHELETFLADEDPTVRFWAARGLTIGDRDLLARANLLRTAIDDADPAVSIAACDGLIATGDPAQRRAGIERLLVLADAEAFGQFVAIEALNVLDTCDYVTDDDRVRIAELPKTEQPPPPRAKGYVESLIRSATEPHL